MTQERIDVEVTDKVDGNVEKKLRGIASGADKAESSVARLKAELASITSGPVQALKAATQTVTSTINAEVSAINKLRAETNNSAVADVKAASSKDRLTEASKRRTAALNDEAAAAARAARPITIRDASVVPQGSGAMFGARAGSRSDAAAQTAAMNVGTEARKAREEIEKFEPAVEKLGQTSGRNRANMANLAAQINDIGVSLAGGQNPLLVFIQQGSQIAYIAGQMETGWLGLAKAAFGLIAPFTVIAAIIGGLYLAFRNFTADMNARHRPELEAYANSLGLTDKEMRKLEGSTVSASGKVKEHSNIVITSGDSWNGFVATVKEGIASLFAPFEALGSGFKSAWGAAMDFGALAFKGFYASVITLVKLLGNSIANTVKIVLNVIIGIAEGAVMVIQGAINAVISGVNLLGGAVNAASEKIGKGKIFENLEKVDLGVKSIGQNALGLEKLNIGETFNNELATVDRTLSAFSKRWDENSVKSAKARMKGIADALKENRNPAAAKKASDPKTQADYLDDENKKLDNQLARMKMLKDAREVQQQLDQIEESFAKRRMALDKTQLEGFRARLTAIQEYKYQQAEMDRIHEEAVGPQRTMNAAVNAATDLFDRGAISAEHYGNEVRKATRNFDEATQPLFALNEQIDASLRASKLYGDAVERGNVIEQARQALVAKGIPLYDITTGKLNEEVAALLKKNDILQQQQYVQTTVGAIVNPMLEDEKFLSNKQAFYDEIQRLRDNDVLSEGAAERAKAQLRNKYNDIQLRGASTFFETLSQLSASKNGELAAIGKAAAVVDATIKGYQAVQNTLATIPPPFNIPAAAAMAAVTGVQVANILSTPTNVGSFNNGTSFIVNGEHGIDQNAITMNVSRGERVSVDTPGQQAAEARANERPEQPIKIFNITDERELLAMMQSEEGDRIITNYMRRNPKKVKSLLGVK